MHKCKAQIKYLVLLLGLSLWIPALAQVHPHGQGRLFEIQQAYDRGEIDVESAALEQFKALHEPETDADFWEGRIKCATPAYMFLHQNRAKLSSETLQKIEAYRVNGQSLKNKATNHTYLSPSGKFTIYYDTTGTDSVSVIDEDDNGIPDYVERVAEAADSSYMKEILEIGFKDPVVGNSAPYPVFIENTGEGLYGETRYGSSRGLSSDTYIRIHHNFNAGFPPNSSPDGHQIGAINATMAHELKHAIQYAQSEWKGSSGSISWSEMDATLMEEVVYDDVNDYYNYIKNGFYSEAPYYESIFFAPHNSIPGAYWHVSWMIYYSEAFGNDVWRDVWRLIENDNFLRIDEALTEVLPDRGFDFASSFVQNHLWHFASGSRAGEDNYGFDEKAFYPYANMDSSFTSVPLNKVEVDSINKLASRYFEVTPGDDDRGAIDVAVDFDSSQVGLGLLFYMKKGETLEMIDTGENKGQVYLPSEILWEEIDKLGIAIANYSNNTQTNGLKLSMGKTGNPIPIRDPEYADLPNEIEIYQNYPNPFNLGTNISFELPRAGNVTLEVFDITGRKVRTLADGFHQLGPHIISFNADGLSSGVYIYRLRYQGRNFTKKMMLVK